MRVAGDAHAFQGTRASALAPYSPHGKREKGPRPSPSTLLAVTFKEEARVLLTMIQNTM